MNAGVISAILGGIIRSLPADIVKEGIDVLLDRIEKAVATSENKIDDAVLNPLCEALRAQLSITEEKGSKYADVVVELNTDTK